MRSESLGQSINAGTSDLRRGRYWASVAASSASSKEARLFGLSEWAVATSQHLVRRGMSLRWAPRTRFLGQFAAVTVGTLSLTFTVLALVLTVSLGQGSIGAGTLVFLLASASIVGNAIGSMPVRAAELSARVEALRGLCGLESTLCSPATSPVRLSAPRQAIVFDGVCFAYPGSVVRALDGVSLRIPAGRSVAVVGANGAGKTTLVKLLGGLHAPTAGRILIDGVDLASCDAQAWRMNIAAAFQDFVRYPLTARDNVGLGAATGTGDPGHADGIAEAAEQAGLSVVIERLASGWDTPLVKDRRGGTDLSGGEWQRVALARAFVGIARGRSVLILDEPTANLDIRAEASFYASFLDLTRGLTTVLISHRFASVRQADLIHVLDGGRVVESGSHDELLARGGRYAAMYAVQAASFADRPAPAEAVAG